VSEIAQRILKRLREQGCLRDEVEAPKKTLESGLSDEELRGELSNEKNRFGPIKIYSRLLDDTLWLAWNEEEMKQLMVQGIKEPAYVIRELLDLRKMTKEELKKVHMVKKVFLGSTLAKA
jgi:DNA-directed RNA polymerase specialized sigma54-like protein